ncbi:class I SAM-dependent methyltransferase [Cohnella sp. GCM10027633]|uniref:class I SAM-dependent methyltransferase n=1 Tax=unclassified Cohnella TaxID=2636738 RepID=UPI00363A350C
MRTRNERSKLFKALDLGCGAGRNGIPIAAAMKDKACTVICVDLLDSAIAKVEQYGKQFEVAHLIKTIKSDIEHFAIGSQEYDLIVAVSALEHVSSEDALKKTLGLMASGTAAGGTNCIVINSNISEIDLRTQLPMEPMFEVNLSTEAMYELLDSNYAGWDVRMKLAKPLAFEIERDDRPVLLTSDCITYVAQRRD